MRGRGAAHHAGQASETLGMGGCLMSVLFVCRRSTVPLPARGNRISNVEPLPGALTTVMAPPCERRIPCTTARPKPRPTNLVVYNGSKALLCVCAVMPQPVLETSHKQ